MSENQPPAVSVTGSGPARPLSVRMTEGLRAKLDVIAQLNDRSVTEEVRMALEAWVEISRSDPRVLQRAKTVRAEIEHEARTRQTAIEAVFGASGGANSPARGAKQGRSASASDAEMTV